MDPLLVLNVEFALSVVVWSIALARYWVPRTRTDYDGALLLIAIIHGLRHVGLIYVQPAAVSPPMPESFAVPTAYGDLLTSVLATIAAFALWKQLPGRYAATWAFTVVGFCDLCLAVYHGVSIRYVEHHPGFGYLLPALVVPGLLSSHLFTGWALWRGPQRPPGSHEG